MREAGITHAEVSLSIADHARIDYGRVGAAFAESGVTLWSWHLPFSPSRYLDPSSSDASLRVATVDTFSTIMRRAAAIGARRFVVHSSSEPIGPTCRALQLENARESLCLLGDVAGELGAMLAVEDLPRTCIGNCTDEIEMLIGTHPHIGVCFDTNHLLLERAEDFLARLGGRLVTLHVSDYDFIDERHLLPGEGKIDWVTMMDALDAAGYEGAFLYELANGSTKHVKRETMLSYGDFVKNAQELHARTPLTVHAHELLF